MKKEITLDEIVKKVGYDPFLLDEIQPKGGLKFNDDRFIKAGDGYISCIHVYEYPEEVDTHWMAKLTNIQNVITTIDIHTEDILQVKKNINKSMKEQDYRYRYAKDYEESRDAELRYAELKNMYDEITSMGEIVKLIHIRIFVSEKTWFDLEERVKNITTSLESDGYKTAVFLNEQENEWKSLYQSYSTQSEQPFYLIGQSVQSELLAAGYPFHYSSLSDPCGTLLGYTLCGGPVLYDEFMPSDKRTFYNALCIGNMGYGKSTLLKNRFLDRAARGDYVRAFDFSGEFTHLTEYLGGKVLRLDGESGVLNMLEILKSGTTESNSFARHISKMHTIYKFWMPSATEHELITFESLLRDLYISKEILSSEGEIDKPITGLPAKAYPILSDLSDLVTEKIERISVVKHNQLEKDIAVQEILRLSNIRDTIDSIIHSFGEILNRHTTIDNIQDTQVITFDLSTVKDFKAGIFDSIFFAAISLCWDNLLTNGNMMKELYETGKVELEDVVRYLIIIDESHRLLNAKKLQAVEQVTIYLREARKFFGGILLASQSIRDYVPEGSSEESIDAMKQLFELTKYKFIFNQDGNLLELLNRIFGYQLTQAELNKIPYLEKGETILSISSDQNIQMKIVLTEEENRLFRGGL